MLEKYKKNEEVICRFIRSDSPPHLLLDVGVGPKSEYITLSQHYPNMRTVGLEPCPIMFADLLPRFPGLLLPYAAWNEETCLELHIDNKHLEGASVFPHQSDTIHAAKIYTRTLDTIDGYLGYPERVLLWMDIEGAELMALQGAKTLLKSGRIRWINLEARDYWDRSNACVQSELNEFLSQFGYKEKLQYNHHNRQSKYGHRDVIYVHELELEEWVKAKKLTKQDV